MQTTKTNSTDKLIPAKKAGWKEIGWRRIGFSNQPCLRFYPGYGHTEHVVLYGHALSLSPLPRKKYRNFFLINLFALIRLFIVRPVAGATVQLEWRNQLIIGKTDTDGFIKLNWRSDTALDFGWHKVSVTLFNTKKEMMALSNADFFVPHSTQFAFISDIDDTFLVLHTANLRKRLAVLFTRNAHTRKPFEGVVNHYCMLAGAQTVTDEPNPFFYVSSSEWNLYSYIADFIKINELPDGILILSTIKNLFHFLTAGGNNHSRKFARIVRLLKDFPKQKFVLLGDSSQQDPYIYESIVHHFPERIYAVYIRDIKKKNSEPVQAVLQKLEASGVPCCFFVHSIEAIAHSKKIGLIK